MKASLAALFLTLGVAVFAAPLAADSQQAGKVYRVGGLSLGRDTGRSPLRTSFLETLAAAGYHEGRNLVLEYRFAKGEPARLSTLAVELVSLRVDVIFAFRLEAAKAALAATQSIPIVFLSLDPVAEGLVPNLARPGGNATGLSLMGRELGLKRAELLKEVVPSLRRLAVLSDGPIDPLYRRWQDERGTALGLEHHILAVRGPDDFESAFKEAQRWGAGAVAVSPTPLNYIHRSPIASHAVAFRLPTIGQFREFAEAGLLMTYAPDERELLRRAANYVDRILKGAKPADLPVEQPTKFEFVINLKTAKALGLTIPRSVLVQADRVIR